VIKNGFTLVEILIYLSIVSVVLLVGTTFIWNVIYGGERTSQYEDLREASRFVLEKMGQEIKKASTITTPATRGNSNSCPAGEEDSCLTIVQSSTTIKFYRKTESNITKIYQKVGENEPVALTPSSVNVTSLTIKNLSPNKSPGVIRAEMVLAHKNNPNITFSTQFSISLRDNQ